MAGVVLFLAASCLIPDTGPYTKAEADQRTTQAATLAALAACEVLKVTDATRKKIVQEAVPEHVQHFTDHHTPAWDTYLEGYINGIRHFGIDEDKVRNPCALLNNLGNAQIVNGVLHRAANRAYISNVVFIFHYNSNFFHLQPCRP